MADEADMAHELEELERRNALANMPKGPRLEPRGSCYNCGEPLTKGKGKSKTLNQKLFCDGDCADDWERRQKLRGRN